MSKKQCADGTPPADLETRATALARFLHQTKRPMLEVLYKAGAEIGEDALIIPPDKRKPGEKIIGSIASIIELQRLYTLKRLIEIGLTIVARIHDGVLKAVAQRVGGRDDSFLLQLLKASQSGGDFRDQLRQGLKNEFNLTMLELALQTITAAFLFEVNKRFPELYDKRLLVCQDWALVHIPKEDDEEAGNADEEEE